MPLERISEFKKDEFRYQSPDGDAYLITRIQQSGKDYINIKHENNTEMTFDSALLVEVAKEFFPAAVTVATPMGGISSLLRPSIIDHRGEGPPASVIDRQVQQVMSKPIADNNVVAALTNDNVPMPDNIGTSLIEAKTGVNIDAAVQPVGETPEEWSITDGQDSGLASWKDDAATRSTMPKPVYQKRGTSGKGFARTSKPSNLI